MADNQSLIYDEQSLIYDDAGAMTYAEHPITYPADLDFDGYGDGDGFPPIHALDLSDRRISIDNGDDYDYGDPEEVPPQQPPPRPPKGAAAEAPTVYGDQPITDSELSQDNYDNSTLDYGDSAITDQELLANADYGPTYDDLPGGAEDYEPVDSMENYEPVDDESYEAPPDRRGQRPPVPTSRRPTDPAAAPPEGLYGEIDDDAPPPPPPKSGGNKGPKPLTGRAAAAHARAKHNAKEGMKRSQAEAMYNEESFYGPAGEIPGGFATASQLPKKVEGTRHSLAYKTYGEIVFCDLPRVEAEAKLAAVAKGKDGVYLLRTSTNLKGGVVVSFHCSGATRHFQFKRDGDCFVNKDGKKVGRTVVELIRYYRHNWQDGLPCAPQMLYLPAPMQR